MAYLTLHENLTSSNEYMKRMAEMMMAKFEKYWSDFSLTLAIAVILDPRYKIDFVDWSYSMVYGKNSIQFQEVVNKLFSTFNEYEMKNSSSTLQVEKSKQKSSDIEVTSETSRGVEAKFQVF